jgi:hypothetical protein
VTSSSAFRLTPRFASTLTTTRTGLRSPTRTSDERPSVMVAEKRPVRRCLGKCDMMRVIDASKPRSSRLWKDLVYRGIHIVRLMYRSASSKTSTSSSLQLTILRPLPRMNSSTRPGVPTTISAVVSKKRETSCTGVEAVPEIRRRGSGYMGGCVVVEGLCSDEDDGSEDG